MNENTNSVESTITSESTSAMNEQNLNETETTTVIIENEGQLLDPAGHALPAGLIIGASTGSGTEGEKELSEELSEADKFFALVSPHTDVTPADVIAAYPNTSYGRSMAAEELRYRAERRYSHLVFKKGSFVQDLVGSGHSKFKNKLRAEVLCPSSTSDNMIWVERASSDFWTFKGCEAYKKVVSKRERAEKALADARK